MNHERVEPPERSAVEQQVEAFAGREAPTLVMRGHAVGAAALLGLFLQRAKS